MKAINLLHSWGGILWLSLFLYAHKVHADTTDPNIFFERIGTTVYAQEYLNVEINISTKEVEEQLLRLKTAMETHQATKKAYPQGGTPRTSRPTGTNGTSGASSAPTTC